MQGSVTSGLSLVLALTRQVMIIEAAIVVVIVVLLVTILVMNQRKKRAMPAKAATPQSYYADLQQQQGGGQPDPFANFGAPPASPAAPTLATPVTASVPVGLQVAAHGFEQPAGVPPLQMAPPVPSMPAPGTPAGWLPDPSGAPDTLRYWDGSTWTQHVAQRT